MSLEASSFYLIPRTTRSGFIKSLIAEPSAKNSGLLATTNFEMFSGIETALMILVIILAVPIGTVDFSTITTLSQILSGLAL